MGIQNDFIVQSNRSCFFCFNKTSAAPQTEMHPFLKQETELHPPTPTIYSLQCLSRFLNMDRRKVFGEQETISPQLLTKVKESTLKVELCDECRNLSNKFSQLYQRLEMIRMEVVSALSNIYDKMLEANKKERTTELWNQEEELARTNPKDGWLGKLEILEVLRTEAIIKSDLKIGSTTPRIIVDNMTAEEISREILKINQTATTTVAVGTLESTLTKSGSEVDISEIQLQNVKEEYPIGTSERDDDDTSNYYDNFGMLGEEESSNSSENDTDLAKVKMGSHICDQDVLDQPTQESTHETKYVAQRKPNYIPTTSSKFRSKDHFNKKSGKYNCSICSGEFRFPSNLKRHLRSVHEKIKYKCTLCNREFSQRSNYLVHHKITHKGSRVQCDVCQKYFVCKSNLTRHHRVTSCGVGKARKSKLPVCQCTYCGQGFTELSNLKRHVKKLHLQGCQ